MAAVVSGLSPHPGQAVFDVFLCMSLLAARLGYARLAEPVRFRHPWEQHASLRLRDGDTTVLAGYDQRGRIHGGDPEP